MTKEELEKEAEVFATYYESLFPNEFETFYKAFLKVAEPREKRIAELEAENEQIKNSDTLCKLIGEQKRKITELEAQIEKMKKRKVFLLQRVDNYDNSIDKQFYTTDEELAKEWDTYYKRNYSHGEAIELEEFSDKKRIREELES